MSERPALNLVHVSVMLAAGLKYPLKYPLREGPSPRGAPSVPLFCTSFPEKRLELKSLKRQTKAEEEGTRAKPAVENTIQI